MKQQESFTQQITLGAECVKGLDSFLFDEWRDQYSSILDQLTANSIC